MFTEQKCRKMEITQFLLVRSEDHPHQKLGNLFIIHGANILFKCKTLELAWRNNRRDISCVPEGTYPIELEYSPKFGYSWELKQVPNRSEVKIHQGNFFRQIEGCILVGDMHIKIDEDEEPDLRNSMATKVRMQKIMEDLNVNKTVITIIEI